MWSETPLKHDLNLKYQIADVQAEVPLVSYVKVNEVLMCKSVRNSMFVDKNRRAFKEGTLDRVGRK